LATLKTKYRLGLSATPYREDKRENLIFALTGYPIGLDWGSLMKILGKHYHDVNVYIVGSEQAKINLVSNLLNKEKKTIIFVNEIAIGEKIANQIGIPFIHGQTKNRMELARNSKVFVASRVMELGVSLKDLEHIIEADFLYGSKREEVQRTGRLMHSEVGETHDILMTSEEFDKYGKRLHGLIEKGFRINLKPMVSGSFKLVKQVETKGKGKGNGNLDVLDSLYDEGFFRTSKNLGEVKEQLKRRGVIGIGLSRTTVAIFSKLNNMVRSRKLFKDKQGGKVVFTMRGG
jgi:DNA excision repair protein ERCC-3